MAGSLAVSPWWTLLDADGLPLSGALVYVYASGTDTPFAVYSDAALTAAHPQPAEADSAGRLTVYLPPLASIRVVVHDENDVPVRETDPINSVDLSAGLSDLLTTIREATIAWPGSDSTALMGDAPPVGTGVAARAPGTAFFQLLSTATVYFEATLWCADTGASVSLYNIGASETPIALSNLVSGHSTGELLRSPALTLPAGTYMVKGCSLSATGLGYAVGYRIFPAFP